MPASFIPLLLFFLGVMATLQWWLINRYIRFPARWIPVTMGGIILGVVFIVWCAYQFPTAGLAIVIILILMGLCIPGAVQSLALRLIFTGTRWWFIGTVVGISTGIVFFYLYLPIDRSYGFIPIFLFFFSYSAFTGFALMKMKPKAL